MTGQAQTPAEREREISRLLANLAYPELIDGVPGGGKTSAANLCRIPRTWRLRRVLRAAVRVARHGLAAWARGTASVTWLAVAGTAGIWIGLANMAEFDRLVVRRPHPMLWALDQIDRNRFVLLTAWGALGLLAAVHAWATDRRTQADDLDDVADRYDDLTDRITEIGSKLASLDDRGVDNTTVLEQVVDSLDAIRKQLAQGGAA